MRIKLSMQKLCFTFMLLCSTILSLTAPPYGYVTTNSGVTVFDTDTNSVVTTIAISGTPSDIAITRDGFFAYITCSGDNTVKQLNLINNTIINTINLTSTPRYIAMTPDGTSALVTSDTKVFKINLQSNSIAGTYNAPVSNVLRGIAISSDSTTVYVTRRDGGSAVFLFALSIATLTQTYSQGLAGFIPGAFGSPGVNEIALSPNGTKVYITSGNPYVTRVTLPSAIININFPDADLSSGTGLAFTPDGTTVYVSQVGVGINQVRPITVSSDTFGAPIFVGTAPRGIAITSDGTTAFVANASSGTITPITLATNTPGTSFSTGAASAQIALAPPQPKICENFNFVPKPFNSIESKNKEFKTLDPIIYFWSDGARRFFIINREKDCPNQTKLMILPFDTLEWDIANPSQGVLSDDGLRRVRAFKWIQDIGATGIIMAGVVNGVVGLE